MAGSTTLLNHSGSSTPLASQKPVTFNSDGRPGAREGGGGTGGAGAAAGPGGGKRPIAHIDDIVSVTADVDPHTPIEGVLQQAELCLRQAISSKTFNRPDLALKDYIKANIILLGIERNKGWGSLQDNKGQTERYQRLARELKAVEHDFERIKTEIKADNAKTGVRPLTQHASLNGHGGNHQDPTSNKSNKIINGGTTTDTIQKGAPQSQRPAQPPPKVKPVVHPKPQNLHGKALQPAGAGAPSNDIDQALAQRFANLRTSTANRVQDPRIRTQPIVPPTVPPPQESPPEPPKPPPTSTPFSSAFAEMPRVPAAIYNPARGTVSSEAGNLPSSAPRAIFTRTNSMTSSSCPPKNQRPPALESMSVIAQKHVMNSRASAPKRTRLTMPPGDTISVNDLLRYMRAGAKDVSILLIDIRSREEFDAGHIMSQATICLESEVLTREHISANEISDSMVLAPSSEQLLFEKRHEFDLVVFYDRESRRIPSKPYTHEEKAISGLYDALSQYDFPGVSETKAGPKLLEGGLEAWTSIVGSNSLQTSSTSSSGPVSRSPMAQALRRRQTYVTRPIQDPEEAKRWKDAIADIGAISPIRTTEDFLRRFPAVSPIQESMVSPVSPISSRPSSPFPVRLSHEESLYTSLPSPPTRPPPTVPRRSHSGLAETGDGAMKLSKRTTLKSGVDHIRKVRTGLRNPGVFCFANSSLQSMFATPGFARDLWTSNWSNLYPVPRKPDENIDNPQLLTRSLASLFHWLDQGDFEAIEAKTIMQYIHHIHATNVDGRKKSEAEIFGGPAQQDAQEFYSFIMDNIHDETNIHRNRKPPKSLGKDYTPKDGTIIHNAMAYWRDYSTASASIVDKYFRGLEVFISVCQKPSCRQVLHQFQPCDVWILNLAGASPDYSVTLDKLLEIHQKPEFFPDLACETCKSPGRTRQAKFARLPDRLAFCLNRFNERSNKIHTKVRFPIRDLDLTRYCAEPDPDCASTEDIHFAGRMRYDCYAVTVHVGSGINGGHYYSYVQDEQSRDPTDWFRCNDEAVDRVKIGSSGSGDLTEAMYQSGNTSAYMVYYRRQGT